MLCLKIWIGSRKIDADKKMLAIVFQCEKCRQYVYMEYYTHTHTYIYIFIGVHALNSIYNYYRTILFSITMSFPELYQQLS